jgi:hypothetical protein
MDFNLIVNYKDSDEEVWDIGYLQQKTDSTFQLFDEKIILDDLVLTEGFIKGKQNINNIYIKLDVTDIQYLLENFVKKKEQSTLFYEEKIKYLGSTLDGKPHGYGIEYNKNGKIFFCGEFENGKRLCGDFTDSKARYLLYSEFPLINGIPNPKKPLYLKNIVSEKSVKVDEDKTKLIVKYMHKNNCVDTALMETGYLKRKEKKKEDNELTYIRYILLMHLLLNIVSYIF